MNRANELWHKCRMVLNLPSGTLLWQSPEFQFRKVYAVNNIVCKVVDLKYDASISFRQNDLAEEFSILKSCAGIAGVPSPIEHHKTDEFEVIVMNRLPGEKISNLDMGWFRFFIIMAKLGIVVLRLSWRGISHNDIKLDNLLVTTKNSVSLVDFDQASRTNFFVAIARNFLGIRIGESKVQRSFISIFKKRFRQMLPSKVVNMLRKVFRNEARSIAKLRILPVLPDDASSQLKSLLKAWEMAQESDANAPGKGLAYYSISLEGHHFPGERPWIDRWNNLRSITDYSGKRILELGCNMGLLSTFLLKDCDAKAAFGVDVDVRILDTAKVINSAFNVKSDLTVVNFGDPGDWETKLIDFKPDIVFALNVLNWVEDKKRLLNFLGQFQEIIFEGHDSLEVETKRLNGVGFKQINVVSTSERGREVIHCQK